MMDNHAFPPDVSLVHQHHQDQLVFLSEVLQQKQMVQQEHLPAQPAQHPQGN